MAKILICGLNYDPEPIGVGRYTGELGRYLAGRGHAVSVVTAPPHYPDWAVAAPFVASRYAASREHGVDVVRCPILLPRKARGISRLLPPISYLLSSAPVTLWKAVRRRPDTVLAIEPTLLSAPVALLAARLAGARAVLHVQDLEVDAAFAVGHLRGERLRGFASRAERAILRRFDKVVAISGKMSERLREKGVPAERLTLIRNWVDLAQIRPLAGPSPFRAELGLAADDFVVLYAGSIGSKQALGVVLDAAERIAGERRVVFVIAGSGPEKAALVERYGHLPSVKFMPLQPEERLRDLLGLADLHVLPQQRGIADLVLPSKLGGMLASGRRLLVMADAGTELHEFVQGVGSVVPAGDSEALAAAILRIASEPEAENVGGREKAGAALSRDGCLADFEAVLLGS